MNKAIIILWGERSELSNLLNDLKDVTEWKLKLSPASLFKLRRTKVGNQRYRKDEKKENDVKQKRE